MHKYVFVDADNQSPKLFFDLLNQLEYTRLSFYIFGNVKSILEQWELNISERPECSIHPFLVPRIHNAADNILTLELGKLILENNTSKNIVIVSRDRQLIDLCNVISEQYRHITIELAFSGEYPNVPLFKNINVYTLKRLPFIHNKIEYLIKSTFLDCSKVTDYSCSKSTFCSRLSQLGYDKAQRKSILRNKIIKEFNHKGEKCLLLIK